MGMTDKERERVEEIRARKMATTEYDGLSARMHADYCRKAHAFADIDFFLALVERLEKEATPHPPTSSHN